MQKAGSGRMGLLVLKFNIKFKPFLLLSYESSHGYFFLILNINLCENLFLVIYTNWGFAQPTLGNGRNAAVMEFYSAPNGTTNYWEDALSLEDREFICKIRKGTEIPKPPSPPLIQPDESCRKTSGDPDFSNEKGDWFKITGKCTFVSSQKMSFYDAQKTCQKVPNNDLISIHSKADQDYFHGAIKGQAHKYDEFYFFLRTFSSSNVRSFEIQLDDNT